MTDSPLSASLFAWGATYTPAKVAPGQEYWRLVQADGPMDIGGNHHLYVDVWGKDGKRVVGVPILFFWDDGDDKRKTEAKTGEPYSANLPMFAGGNAYGVRIDDGSPSDALFGVGMGNKVPHQSFRAIFQRAVAESNTPTPPPPPPPAQPPVGQPLTKAQIIEAIDFYWAMLKGLP